MPEATNWRETYHPARLEEKLEDGKVKCHLSPRMCQMRPGQKGFCGVRGNVDGNLVTYNYGKSVHATEECIETEATFHFSPGERILSMGNIGCMLNCDYCHNWKTSQARYVSDQDVFHYTPEKVVEIAQRHNIRVISWTYNDPVVWHEFVRDGAAAAKEAGLVNLYKSAFFITPEAVDELIPYIDIFSISIKAIDAEYYRKLTKGWMEPVLDATEQAYKSGKHVEISTLMVTDLSDDEKTAADVARFALERLDSTVPVHFVRFHPDYKLTNTTRTPIPNLHRAQEVALEMGVEHCYLGNLFDTKRNNTVCKSCDETLVSRYGLTSTIHDALDRSSGKCKCGTDAHIRFPYETPPTQLEKVTELPEGGEWELAKFDWHGDVANLHVQLKNKAEGEQSVCFRELGRDDKRWTKLDLQSDEGYRFLVSKCAPESTGCEVAIPKEGMRSSLHQVFDRAHFPTVSVDEGTLNKDVTPFPRYDPKLKKSDRLPTAKG